MDDIKRGALTIYDVNYDFSIIGTKDNQTDIDSVRNIFKGWAKKQRTMSNVEILDIKLLNECTNVINV